MVRPSAFIESSVLILQTRTNNFVDHPGRGREHSEEARLVKREEK